MARLVLLPIALMLGAAAPAGAPIIVAVTGVDSAKGNVHVDICPEAKFLKEDCPWSADVPAVAGTTVVTIRGVPPGRYAAQGFHDANANHKVDRGLFGIPTERIGFSNDAPVHLGPPKWTDAQFVHGSGPQHIGFAIRRLP